MAYLNISIIESLPLLQRRQKLEFSQIPTYRWPIRMLVRLVDLVICVIMLPRKTKYTIAIPNFQDFAINDGGLARCLFLNNFLYPCLAPRQNYILIVPMSTLCPCETEFVSPSCADSCRLGGFGDRGGYPFDQDDHAPIELVNSTILSHWGYIPPYEDRPKRADYVPPYVPGRDVVVPNHGANDPPWWPPREVRAHFTLFEPLIFVC